MIKKLNFKATRAFWAYICIGVITVLFGVVLAPAWSGTNVFFKSCGMFQCAALVFSQKVITLAVPGFHIGISLQLGFPFFAKAIKDFAS